MSDQATVYIVDDEPDVCNSVVALVTSMGMVGETFSSAEDFLETFDPDRHGCLVTDLRMHGMSGLELQDHLRSQGMQLPIVFITAYADVPTTVQIMRNGATNVLEKPFRGQDLWESINTAIRTDAESRTINRRAEETRQLLERLSENERKVMDLLVAGEMNKTIAKQLGVALRTVEQRRHDLLQKLGVDSLAALVRLSIEAEAAA